MTFVADADFLPLRNCMTSSPGTGLPRGKTAGPVRRSPGNTTRCAGGPADPLSDLVELPLTDKSTAIRPGGHPPFGSYLNYPYDRIVRLHRTSGTSGQAMNLALSVPTQRYRLMSPGAARGPPA
ncbi:MAG: hypothetical protein CM1200mP20_16190 [Pseudomonadota bacterium]|nr:MAG: hypothetical protein CM1200mP20_16190 [Pseudomonadota bacterium]